MTRAVADDLRAARDLLVADGWIQGAPVSACGRCLVAALTTVTTRERYGPVRNAVFRFVVTQDDGLATWNDAPGRTFADVLALLDKAIAAEEARL